MRKGIVIKDIYIDGVIMLTVGDEVNIIEEYMTTEPIRHVVVIEVQQGVIYTNASKIKEI